jgi:hypothetical protein
VANKPKPSDRDRRAKVEEMRRQEAAKERRKSLLFITIAVLVGVGLVAAAAVPAYLSSRNDPANKALDSYGVAASEADCGDVTNEDASGNNEHREDGTTVEYDTVPPSSGPHWGQPASPAKAFYTERDAPAVEQLVHNMEHGYTVLWYDDTLSGDERAELRDLSASAREQDSVGQFQKFVVAPWDDSKGSFPEGKRVALSHWGAQEGYRQLCGKISGEAVQSFIDDFPATDAPEPNTQ